MKLFIAGLATESNTFSPIPTGRTGFEECMVAHGDATQQPANIYSAPMHVWRKRGEENHMEVVESLAAFAQPAGVTVREVYESYRDEILRDLAAAMPVDIALFSMHGARRQRWHPVALTDPRFSMGRPCSCWCQDLGY